MAKDLPYFKFFVSEWNDGDVTLEDYKIQGLFINVCAYYWSRECELDYTTLLKKFKHNVEGINAIIECNLLKLDGDVLSINFLDEQLSERKQKSNINKINGSKGGRPKKRKETETKPNGLNSLTETKGIKKREEKKREDSYTVKDILKEKETLTALMKTLNISKQAVIRYFDEFKIPYLTDSYNEVEYKDRLTHFIRTVKKSEKDRDTSTPRYRAAGGEIEKDAPRR